MPRIAALSLGALLVSFLPVQAEPPLPSSQWPNFEIIMWQPQPVERLEALRRLGISAGMVPATRQGPWPPPDFAVRISPFLTAGMPWYVENVATDFYAAYHRWTPAHAPEWAFELAHEAYQREPADPAVFIRQPSLCDPGWQARIADRLRAHVALHQPYRPLYYSLADESGIADLAAPWDFDLAACSLTGMRAWLREQYAAARRARGRSGGRPRLMTRAKLRTAMTMMADRNNVASEVAEQLGISLSTLYAYVDGEGRPKPRASKLLAR